MRQFHAKLTALAYPGCETFGPLRSAAWWLGWRSSAFGTTRRGRPRQTARRQCGCLAGGTADLPGRYPVPLLGTEAENDRGSVIEWLLSRAVSLQFGDTFKQAADSTAAAVRNPLDRLDFEADDFKRGVQELATLLKVPHHPDHKEVLKACCLLIAQRLSPESISIAPLATKPAKVEKIRLDEVPIGFDTAPGSRAGAELARILRLLYLADLRTLQTQINHAIVQVQAIQPADPKTDETIGKSWQMNSQ
uniref:Type VI secretion system protein TssA n=1 Tax=Macrostomum lignano TaxID=282301 RepID=A0A1I8G275_9PLAT